MPTFFEIQIGHERTNVVRVYMTPSEVVFPLQKSLRRVRYDIELGRLPIAINVRPRRIDAPRLAAQLLGQHDDAVEFIRGWAEGRFEMPRTSDIAETPPLLSEYLHLLRRPLPCGAAQAQDRTPRLILPPNRSKNATSKRLHRPFPEEPKVNDISGSIFRTSRAMVGSNSPSEEPGA